MDPTEPPQALRELVRKHGLENVVRWVFIGGPRTVAPSELVRLQSEHEGEQLQGWLMEIAFVELPGIRGGQTDGFEEGKR
jgi:hypothetical protein